jgi:hypothetical protein
MKSMFDRLFDAVSGDVALANVLAQKFDDFIAFIAFSGEAKDADAFISQVADNAARFRESDEYLIAAVDDLFDRSAIRMVRIGLFLSKPESFSSQNSSRTELHP